MIALVLAAALSARVDAQALDLLEAVRTAVGGDAVDRLGPYELKGTYQYRSAVGTWIERCDPAHGKFERTRDLGLWSDDFGTDGSRVWTADSTGDMWLLSDADDVDLARIQAYLCGMRYLRPGSEGETITYLSPEVDPVTGVALAEAPDSIAVTLPHLDPFQIRFDPTTHLIAEVDLPSDYSNSLYASYETDSVLYGEFRQVQGVLVPFHRSTKFVNPEASSVDVHWDEETQAAFTDASVSSAIAFQHVSPRDWSFVGGESSTTVPVVPLTGANAVRVTINGKGPYLFLIDTTMPNLISDTLAKSLSLTTDTDVANLKDRYFPGNHVRPAQVVVGDLTMNDQPFTIDSTVSRYGRQSVPKIDGVLGFQLFRRVVVDLDQVAQTVTFIDPARFTIPADSSAVPFDFFQYAPVIQATVDDTSFRLLLDTGLAEAVVIDAEMSTNYDPNAASLKAVGSRGAIGADFVFGQYASCQPAQFSQVIVAGISVPGATGCLTDIANDDSSYEYDGAIGDGLLARFSTIFDYVHQRAFLTSQPELFSPHFSDRSGIVFGGELGHWLPMIIPGSPADISGLSQSTIVSIEGSSIDQLTLVQLLKLLDQPAGTTLSINFKRGGTVQAAALNLSDYR